MTALIGLRRRPSASRKSTRATIMGEGPRNTAAMADQDKKDLGIKALGDARNRPVPPIPDRETVRRTCSSGFRLLHANERSKS